MKKVFYLILTIVLCIHTVSCNDDDKEKNTIEGTIWKLMTVEEVFSEKHSYDYSANKIIYEFATNATLIISSDIDDYKGGDSPGEYTYEIIIQTDNNNHNILMIDNSFHEYYMEHDKLVISSAALDGSILYFNKINN